jgi:hypothetical protein
MRSVDWSSVAVAAILLIVTTRLSLLAVRAPEPHDDVPDFLPPEGHGALIMLLLAVGMFVISAKMPSDTTLDRIIVVADLLSGANALLVSCVLFRIHRIKSDVEAR